MIKYFNLNSSNYPDINWNAQINCIDYFYFREKKEWFFLEELFIERPKMLSYVIELLFQDGLKNEAFSIIKRNNLIENGYLVNEQIKSEVLQNQELIYIESPLKTKDQFKPVEHCIYEKNSSQFTLDEFNIRETENFIYVETFQSPEFERAKAILLGESMEFGLDIEKPFSFTKLEEHDKKISLIQFSNLKDVIIFDMQTFEVNPETQKLFHKLFFENINKKFIGVGISQDIGDLLGAFQLYGKNISVLIELQKLFKFIYPKEKLSSLSFITKFLTGKEISKTDQVSNWHKRPLRKSQLHYAAMDAVIGLHCLNKFKEINGSQIIDNYVDHLMKNQQ